MRRGLLALVLIVIIGGGAGYWYWTTTPVYSILQVHNAVKNHDVEGFNKYVDVDSVASNLVDVLLARPVGALDALGHVGRILGFGLVNLVKPRALDSIKQEINELVEQGGVGPAPMPSTSYESNSRSGIRLVVDAPTPVEGDEERVNGISLKGVLRHYGFTGKVFNGVKYTKIEGKMAHVGLSLHNQKYNQDLVLDLRLHDMGGYWRIDQLSNLPDLMSTLMRLETEYQQQGLPPAA